MATPGNPIGAGPGVTATVSLDVSRIAKKIEAMAGDLPEAVRLSLRASLEKIVTRMKAEKLSGSPAPVKNAEFPRAGQYLAVRTGRGRSSMKFNVSGDETRIVGEFGPTGTGGKPDPGVYMTAHEQGFHGRVAVRAHERRGFAVRAHERLMDMPARRYLRAALLDARPEIHRDILVTLEALFGRAGAVGA